MVAHVANGTGYTGTASTSHTVDMPIGLANGDVVTVGFCVNNSATVSAAGWTQEINENFTGAALVMLTHVVTDAGSEPTSVTFTFSSSQSANGGASAWSGVDTSDPTSVIGSFATVSVASSINAPSITTTADGDMAVAMCAVNSSSQVWGTAPWTGDFQTTGAQCWAQSHLEMPTAGATGVATFSLDTKDAGAIVFSLRAGAAPDPPPDAVDDLAGTAGAAKLDLTWTEPPLNGSTLLDPAYQLRFRTSGTGDAPSIVDPTSSGNDVAANPQNVAYPAHSTGDLVIQTISIDANVTATIPSTGPNGETITALATNANPGTAGPRGSAWWWVSTGDETAGNISVSMSANEQTSSECIVIPAGTFDPSNPIPDVSSIGTQTSGTGVDITFPGLTASVAGGLVIVMGGVDADPMDNPFSPAGWTDVITHDQGAVSSFVAVRDATTTVSESVASAAFGINTGDTAWCVGFVVAPAGAPPGSWIELPQDITIPASVTADVETALWSGASGDVADDPAIYYHAADPSASIVLGSSKSTGADGGVHSFDLSGTLLDSWLVGEVNSVDLIDTATVDVDSSWADRVLVLATERGDGDLVFGFLDRATGEITSAGTTAVGWEPYGCCLYVSPVDGAIYAFVNEATGGSNRWRQFELTVSGSTVSGSLVRSGSTESLAEGMCADYQNGRILIGVEDDRLAWFLPEPGDATTLNTIEAEGVHFTADIEGITVVPAMNGQHGVIIVSSQGSSEFVVYNLDDDSYMGTFVVNAGSADAVTGTDGIAALRAPMGAWTNGLFVCHDETNTGGGASNFKFVDLGDILGPIPQSYSITGTSATVGDLTNGVAYDFEVRALSDAGPSPWSNTAGPYTPVAAGGSVSDVVDTTVTATTDVLDVVHRVEVTDTTVVATTDAVDALKLLEIVDTVVSATTDADDVAARVDVVDTGIVATTDALDVASLADVVDTDITATADTVDVAVRADVVDTSVAATTDVLDTATLVDLVDTSITATVDTVDAQMYVDLVDTVIAATTDVIDAGAGGELVDTVIAATTDAPDVAARIDLADTSITATTDATDSQAWAEVVDTTVAATTDVLDTATLLDVVDTVVAAITEVLDTAALVEVLDTTIDATTDIVEGGAMFEVVDTVVTATTEVLDLRRLIDVADHVFVATTEVLDSQAYAELVDTAIAAATDTLDVQTWADVLDSVVTAVTDVLVVGRFVEMVDTVIVATTSTEDGTDVVFRFGPLRVEVRTRRREVVPMLRPRTVIERRTR